MKDTYRDSTTSRRNNEKVKDIKLSDQVIKKIRATAIGLTTYQYNDRYNWTQQKAWPN